jgi:hypothetical protein
MLGDGRLAELGSAHCPCAGQLEELNISKNTFVTRFDFTGCERLRFLDVSMCKMGDLVFSQILMTLPNGGATLETLKCEDNELTEISKLK